MFALRTIMAWVDYRFGIGIASFILSACRHVAPTTTNTAYYYCLPNPTIHLSCHRTKPNACPPMRSVRPFSTSTTRTRRSTPRRKLCHWRPRRGSIKIRENTVTNDSGSFSILSNSSTSLSATQSHPTIIQYTPNLIYFLLILSLSIEQHSWYQPIPRGRWSRR